MDISRLVKIDKSRLLKLMKIVVDEGEKEGLKLILDGGTLLGVVREKDFLFKDVDVDINILPNQKTQLINVCKSLIEKGLVVNPRIFDNRVFKYETISVVYNHKEMYPKIDFRLITHIDPYIINYKEGIHNLDIKTKHSYLLSTFAKYIFYVLSKPDFIGSKPRFLPEVIHKGLFKLAKKLPSRIISILNNVINVVLIGLNYECNVSKFPKKFSYLTEINFKGMCFFIPEFFEEYLEYYYGNSWKEPNINWRKTKEGKESLSKIRIERSLFEKEVKNLVT